MLYTGNKYYYLGQIASDEITGINNEKLLKQRTDSLSLHNESNSSVIGINAASDTDTEIMKFILSGDMPFYVDNLNNQNNSLRPKEIFEKNTVKLSYSLVKESTAKNNTTHEIKQSKISKEYTYAKWAEKFKRFI